MKDSTSKNITERSRDIRNDVQYVFIIHRKACQNHLRRYNENLAIESEGLVFVYCCTISNL